MGLPEDRRAPVVSVDGTATRDLAHPGSIEGDSVQRPPSARKAESARHQRLGFLVPLVACAVPAVVYLGFVAHFAVNSIYWDEWNLVPLVNAGLHSRLTLAMLWAPHNENRMAVPDLFFLLFARFDHFDTRTIMFAGAILSVLSYLLYLRVYRAWAGRPLRSGWIFVVGFVWFSFVDAGNALWGFQFAWFLVAFLLMALLGVLAAERLTAWVVGGAALVAVAASFSSLQGLLLWPVGFACLLWRAEDRRTLLRFVPAWVVAGAAATGLYFSHLPLGRAANGGGSISYAVNHPGHVARYVLAAVGNVLPLSSASLFSDEVAGGVVLALALLALIRTFRLPRRGTRVPLPLALVLFGLLFDVVAAFGRVSLGVPEALASRYTMANLLLVAGVFAAFARPGPSGLHARVRRPDPWRVVAGAAGVVALAALAVTGARSGVAQARNIAAERRAGAVLMLDLAVRPSPGAERLARHELYPSWSVLRPLLDEAKADDLSVFAARPSPG